jgi:hypothetical protein
METNQKNLVFDDPRNNRRFSEESAGKTAAPDTRVVLDREICSALADYVKRYAADDSLIEVKGKLIKFIRGI